MVIFGYAYHKHTPTSISKFTWAYAIDNAYHSYLVCQTDIALLYSKGVGGTNFFLLCICTHPDTKKWDLEDAPQIILT